MVEALVGTWRLEGSENFEEFLQALGKKQIIILFRKYWLLVNMSFLGCNYILRKAGMVVTPDLIIGSKDEKVIHFLVQKI